MAVLSNIRRTFSNFINPDKFTNAFARAFYTAVGGGFTQYEYKNKEYLEKGYGMNSTVYSVISQMSTKTASIPFYVKKIKATQQKHRLDSLKRTTKGLYTPQQELKKMILESKAYDEKILDFPMERPNTLQTWGELLLLYKTFLRTTGNAYFYMLRPSERENAPPQQVYILPSHMVQIVLRSDADTLSDENPISHYVLTEGETFTPFRCEDVIHVKMANPFYDKNGSHLYGLSPLRAALRNIQSSNEAMDNNIKTLSNNGAFGFIHGKSIPLTPTQAQELKERLREMDSSKDRMANVAGMSAEVGFTRISLTTDELKPFDFLKYDEKQICNVLGWSDKLLNNDDGAKYDNVNSFRQQVITDNILPDLQLLESAFNSYFLPLFKGYEGTILEFDISELPEMQSDVEKLSAWLKDALDRGVINRNEYRSAIKYPESEDKSLDIHTVSLNTMSLDEAIAQNFSIDEPSDI